MYVYNELFGSTRGVLLYPGTGGGTAATTGRFHDAAHACETAYVELFDDGGKASPAFVQAQLTVLVTAAGKEGQV